MNCNLATLFVCIEQSEQVRKEAHLSALIEEDPGKVAQGQL